MDQLKRLRVEKGLSQARLAARAGLDPSTVNQIERGAREASPVTLRKLAEALDVSIANLLESESPKVPGPAPLEPPTVEALLERAGVSTRWATMPDDEWNEIFDEADLEYALALCYEVAVERLATQELRWALGTPDRSIEERRVVARMLSIYMTREFQASIKSRDREAVLDSEKAMRRELVGALG
jgi:transcriptional regulator with XRE-family HTH domain